MSDKLKPGSMWRDKNPETGPQYRHEWRRVVEVISADPAFHGGARVHGTSFWQHLNEGEWCTEEGPGARRRTTILRDSFLRRFEHLEEQP